MGNIVTYFSVETVCPCLIGNVHCFYNGSEFDSQQRTIMDIGIIEDGILILTHNYWHILNEIFHYKLKRKLVGTLRSLSETIK